MLTVQVKSNRDVIAELKIAKVNQLIGEGRTVHVYQLTNVVGKPTFTLEDNSSWDKVVILAIRLAIRKSREEKL